MRSLLSNYLAEDREPVSINALKGNILNNRHLFDESLGLSSAFMTYGEIRRHRPKFHDWLAKETDVAFSKTHEPYQYLPDGRPLFSLQSFSRVIHIVRNPLDIAVSYAHHLQCDISRAIEVMADRKAMEHDLRNGITTSLPQLVSDWSGNVSSWLDQDALPVKTVSYEAMHANTESVLADIIDFWGLIGNPAKLGRAVENSRFHRLKEQESLVVFKEKNPVAPNFFRKGKVGDWRTTLTDGQIQAIVERHGAVMARLGYAEETGTRRAKQ